MALSEGQISDYKDAALLDRLSKAKELCGDQNHSSQISQSQGFFSKLLGYMAALPGHLSNHVPRAAA
jgi:hypothetical protein